jgi:hypothetical protein
MLAREDDAMMKIKLRIMKQLRKNVYGSVTNLRLQDRVLSRNENQQLVAVSRQRGRRSLRPECCTRLMKYCWKFDCLT